MTSRARIALLAAIVVLAIAAVSVVAIIQARRAHERDTAPTDVALAEAGAFDGESRIVFRSTAPGQLFGRVSIVGIDDPAGPRDVLAVACDRVDAVEGRASCLRTERGIATTFSATILDEHWEPVVSWPLPGIPSRTRLSDDGTRMSSTAFVTGHSYAIVGFSTETVVHGLTDPAAPEDFGNIEFYDLLLDGSTIAPVDRNMWGVTFVDDTVFYATTQSQALGKTWLVRGDLEQGTLEVVAEGVECPSISPDRTRIAFKADTDPGSGIHWTPAVLDIASNEVTVLDVETTSINDQIEWLDDETILYGLPRVDQPGVTDVWSLATDGDQAPAVLIPEAWSPAVIR
ncbi:hypothetical protein [Salana multivorans]